MKIIPAKSISYDSVESKWIVNYIKQYSDWIYQTVNENGRDVRLGNVTDSRLCKANKTQLKQIAAELETVQKRLKFILEGVY